LASLSHKQKQNKQTNKSKTKKSNFSQPFIIKETKSKLGCCLLLLKITNRKQQTNQQNNNDDDDDDEKKHFIASFKSTIQSTDA
jgi:hypothetical protein